MASCAGKSLATQMPSIQFTAIIVSGATSDAELLVMSVTRFSRLAAGPARTTSVGKLRLYIVPVKRLIQSIVP